MNQFSFKFNYVSKWREVSLVQICKKFKAKLPGYLRTLQEQSKTMVIKLYKIVPKQTKLWKSKWNELISNFAKLYKIEAKQTKLWLNCEKRSETTRIILDFCKQNEHNYSKTL